MHLTIPRQVSTWIGIALLVTAVPALYLAFPHSPVWSLLMTGVSGILWRVSDDVFRELPGLLFRLFTNPQPAASVAAKEPVMSAITTFEEALALAPEAVDTIKAVMPLITAVEAKDLAGAIKAAPAAEAAFVKLINDIAAKFAAPVAQ